jgi:hypothetical protein
MVRNMDIRTHDYIIHMTNSYIYYNVSSSSNLCLRLIITKRPRNAQPSHHQRNPRSAYALSSTLSFIAIFPLLISFSSFFFLLSSSRSTSLITGGRASIGSPNGARMRDTTWRTFRLTRQPALISTMSPARREERGSWTNMVLGWLKY